MTALLIVAAILIGVVMLIKSVSSVLASIAIGAIIIGVGVALFDAALSGLVIKAGIFLIIVLIAIKVIASMRD